MHKIGSIGVFTMYFLDEQLPYSRALSVHVNVAKQMLFSFSQKNKDKVQLVYLLAGNQVKF